MRRWNKQNFPGRRPRPKRLKKRSASRSRGRAVRKRNQLRKGFENPFFSACFSALAGRGRADGATCRAVTARCSTRDTPKRGVSSSTPGSARCGIGTSTASSSISSTGSRRTGRSATAWTVTRLRTPPNEDESLAASASSMPVTSEKATKTDCAQLYPYLTYVNNKADDFSYAGLQSVTPY